MRMDVFEAFDDLEQATAELSKFIGGCKASITECEGEDTQTDDIVKHIKGMRRLLKSSLGTIHGLETLVKAVNIRKKQFARTVQQFEDHVSRTALNYGVNLIPDELLAEIFVFTAQSLEEKVSLSLVCRRFRTIMLSMRKMWSGHRLELGQTPEEMVAIAEGNRFDSLKAALWSRRFDWSGINRRARAYGRMFDFDGHEDRFYEQSVDFILPLRLEQLYIDLSYGTKYARRILDSAAMQSIRTLAIRAKRIHPWPRLERRHAPSLQNLASDVVPRPSVGTGLIQCKLSRVEEEDLDSLREFLASANSLRYLLLQFNYLKNFYEALDLPSLRSLEVNFIPHPSLARHLTQFTFFGKYVCLSKLLAFLPSTEALQVLAIHADREFSDDIYALQAVTLPHLTSCKIHQTGFHSLRDPPFALILLAELQIPALRRLELRFTRKRFDEFDNRYDTDPEFPHQDALGIFNEHLPGAFPVPHQRLIRFEECSRLKLGHMKTASGYLADMGDFQIKLNGCEGWRDGTFRLDELESALLFDHGEEDSSLDGFWLRLKYPKS